MTNPKIFNNLGPVLLGGFIALALCGIVNMQVYIYSRTFRGDYVRIKILVLIVWLLDLTHSGLVCAANWGYLIDNFGDDRIMN